MDVTQASMMHHVCIVLFALWLLSKFDRCTALAYFASLIYLYLVHEVFIMRLRKKVQFEEKTQSNQRKVLTDSETVRWLNHAVEKIWPICMEQITSQKILRPIIPWFLEKYKPWTAKKAIVQHLYLGRNPPMFTEMRVLRQSSEDDHLVLELGMNFLTADDMSAILAVQLRKRLGFGMWAKLHLTSMHVEGKVLVGIKFIPRWPFLGRLRVCFAEPPYFQMTVKPLFTHGIDVTEIPGIDGWLDNLLSVAFEETLVEPNMLVVDVEKFAGPPPQEDWFTIDMKEPVAYAKVEVIEASEMKPSDLNGLADPYVKGQMGPYRFKTKIQKKTLAPKWLEEFRIPIISWESPNTLNFEVHDKDHIFDDALGTFSININDLKDGQRHDTWVPLENITMGRLHVAITIEGKGKDDGHQPDSEQLTEESKRGSFATDTTNKDSSVSSEKSAKVADKFEPIEIDGQKETAVWVQQPGSEVPQTWEPRKGKSRRLDTEIQGEQNDASGCIGSNTDKSVSKGDGIINEKVDDKQSTNPVRRGINKIGSLFQRNPKVEHQNSMSREVLPSPHANLRSIKSRKIGVNFVAGEEAIDRPASARAPGDGITNSDGSGCESPSRGHHKRNKAKNFLKQAEKSARTIKHVLSRKGTNKFKGDSSAAVAGNGSSQSDSSDDESLSPSVNTSMDGTIRIESQPVCLGDISNGNKILADTSDQTMDMGNLSKDTNVQGSGRAEDETTSSNGSIEGKLDEVEPKAVISVPIPEDKVLSFDEQKG
ncbi:hypothetical protein NL676_027082 [Syzygium grande]|nr:hypothetical protein NL676_027082 [Syzygium grande]